MFNLVVIGPVADRPQLPARHLPYLSVLMVLKYGDADSAMTTLSSRSKLVGTDLPALARMQARTPCRSGAATLRQPSSRDDTQKRAASRNDDAHHALGIEGQDAR
ncbi:hypothetical protein FS749_011969 [Ceratobasidium sp. UAMH 11750]|nr:hypothetical protein FS749_011969 [Ceratobasidium sp. UAMH 11750]